MTDQIMRDIIAAMVIAVYLGLLAFKLPVDQNLASLALIAFGYFFKGTSAGWSLKPPPKVAAVLFLFMILGIGSARADLFNPVGPGTNGKYKQFLTSVNGPSGNTLQDIETVLNYLGEREGYAYNGRLKQWDITTGATAVSIPAYNLAIAGNVLTPTSPNGSFFDGWSIGAEWNVGNYLAPQVQNVPVLQYITQAYVGLYAREEKDRNGNYQFAPMIGGDIKISFGPQTATLKEKTYAEED
jgi:hypothetical protein